MPKASRNKSSNCYYDKMGNIHRYHSRVSHRVTNKAGASKCSEIFAVVDGFHPLAFSLVSDYDQVEYVIGRHFPETEVRGERFMCYVVFKFEKCAGGIDAMFYRLFGASTVVNWFPRRDTGSGSARCRAIMDLLPDSGEDYKKGMEFICKQFDKTSLPYKLTIPYCDANDLPYPRVEDSDKVELWERRHMFNRRGFPTENKYGAE